MHCRYMYSLMVHSPGWSRWSTERLSRSNTKATGEQRDRWFVDVIKRDDVRSRSIGCIGREGTRLKPSRAWNRALVLSCVASRRIGRRVGWKYVRITARARGPFIHGIIMLFGAVLTWSTVNSVPCSAAFQFLKGVTGRWNTLTSVIALCPASPTISFDTRGVWRSFY